MNDFRAYDELPSLVVDHRERKSGLFEILAESELFDVREDTLDCGDVVVGQLVVERKSGPDFARSIFDGRLFPQLILMKRIFRKRLLIVEGDLPSDHGPRERRAIDGATLVVTASLQIPIVYTTSIQDSVKTLRQLALREYREGNEITRLRFDKQAGSLDFHRTYTLAGLPQIGVLRAKSLLAYFGSLEKIFSAPEEELMKVEGIGKVLAGRLVEVFRGSISS